MDGQPAQRWLFGPVPDLLLGCGGAYFAVFLAQALAGPSLRSAFPMGVLPFLILLTGMPHYGATLMRVWNLADRARHARLLTLTSVVLAVAIVASVHVAWVGSLMLTVYLTWSP